jgi:NADH-quinone oxidoreductase subunit M
LFYVFWEAMLVPMYLIIGVWGGERRLYAAIKFFLYTLIGGVLMLAGIVMLYYALPEGQRTMSIPKLLGLAPSIGGSLQITLFILFGLGFAIKVPMFPFHTWLPDAHVEAPTSGSVILAGVLLKMGAYGFLRLCVGFFPVATEMLGPVLMWLSVIGIIYGGAAAMWQKDMKRLIAYSSVSHLGFVMLGVFALNSIGIQGAVLQMVNHGLSTGALFLLVGMIYERRHTRMIEDYSGLWDEVPVYSRIFLVVALSSIGLPGLNGFVGELLTLMGTFDSGWIQGQLWAILGALGVIIAACYLLWMYKRVFYGEPKPHKDGPMADVRPIEATAAVMLLAAIVWLGVYPAPVLRSMKPAVNMVVKRFETARGSDAAGLQPLTALAPKVGTLGGIDTPEEDDEQ